MGILNSWHAQRDREFKRYVPMETKAKRALAFINQYQAEHGGVSPSFTDLQTAIGVGSKSLVHKVMAHLQAAGKIRCMPHRARAIEVLPHARPQVSQSLSFPNATYFKVERIDDEAVLVQIEVKR